MAISDKTRKLLWGRSGNRCSICRKELVVDKSTLDDNSIIGEECHIASEKVNGPRYNNNYDKSLIDAYDNLILLCRIHHKIIDDQTSEYTESILKDLKEKHERWVKERLEDGHIKPLRFRTLKDNKVEFLFKIYSGKQLFNIIDRAGAFYSYHPEPENEHEVEIFGQFLQSVQDWGDISSDLEASDRVKATFELGRLLKEVEENGFWVFGNKGKKILEGGVNGSSIWTMAYVNIVRNDNPSIINFSIDETQNNNP